MLITECMYQVEKGLPDGYISNVKERAEVISVDDPAAKVYVPDIGVAREFPRRRQAAAPEEGGGVALAVEIEPVTIPSVIRSRCGKPTSRSSVYRDMSWSR